MTVIFEKMAMLVFMLAAGYVFADVKLSVPNSTRD